MKTNKSHHLLHDRTWGDQNGVMRKSVSCQGAFSSCHERWTILFLWLTFICNGSLFLDGFAQDKCENALADAQSLDVAGRFADAILRLDSCLPDNIPADQKIHAYRLLAICFLKEDYPVKARAAIRKIFDLKRQYEPDLVQDPQNYLDLVAEVKASLPKPLNERLFGGFKKWLWISGGGIASGLIIASLGSANPPGPVPEPERPNLDEPPRP